MAPTLREYLNTGGQDGRQFWAQFWPAQTFTVGATGHTITSVKILMYRAGSPGTITVSIRATSSSLPTGADLTSGTTDGNTLTTNAAGEWRETTVTELALSPSTMYAIAIRAPSGSYGNHFDILENWGGGYAGGSYCYSTDSGVNWASYGTSEDGLFEVWGNSLLDIPTVTTQAATSLGLD